MTRYIYLGILFSFVVFARVSPAFATGHPEFEALFLNHVKAKAAANEKWMVYTRSTTTFPCITARIGVMSCDFTKLNQSAIVGSIGQFSSTPVFAGLTYEFPWRVRKVATFTFNVDFNYLLGQDLKFSNLQEVTLNGFSFGGGIGKDLLPGYRWIDLVISVGFEAGRFKAVYSDYAHTSVDQISTKQFICPKVQIYPKYIFNYLVIGLRGSYRIDMIAPDWVGSTAPFGAASATGWTVEAVIGVQLGIYN